MASFATAVATITALCCIAAPTSQPKGSQLYSPSTRQPLRRSRNRRLDLGCLLSDRMLGPHHGVAQRPAVQTRVAEEMHPSGGRGVAYSQDFRTFAVHLHNNGQLDDYSITQAQVAKLFPSKQSVKRYLALIQLHGHCRPCRRTGNRRAEVLRDHDIVFLALYRVAFPKCSAAQINAFLYRINYGDVTFRFYTSPQITKAETRIGLTRKCGSTTAYQAYLPINIRKRWMYWNLPYPFGIADIRVEDFIDLDECGVFVETADKHYGKAYVGNRVRQEGNYQKSEKWTLLLAVAGSAVAERWAMMWLEGGTTGDRMIEFIELILNAIGPGTPARRRCFTMDNLSSHHNLQVAAMILTAGHRIAFRAPYYPIDGPIEFVFNSVQTYLAINSHLVANNGTSLRQWTMNGIANIRSFVPYYNNCGLHRQ